MKLGGLFCRHGTAVLEARFAKLSCLSRFRVGAFLRALSQVLLLENGKWIHFRQTDEKRVEEDRGEREEMLRLLAGSCPKSSWIALVIGGAYHFFAFWPSVRLLI